MLERKSRHAEVIRCHLYVFEVVLFDLRVGVQLDNWRCDCNAWELKGIPCVHALACIHFIRANIEEYVDPYFTFEKWRKIFDGVVHPIPSRIYWPPFPESALLVPPIPKRQTGRPRLHRTRATGEQGPVATRALTIKCKLCKQSGHNKRSCAMNPNKGKTQEGRKARRDNTPTRSTDAEPSQPAEISQVVRVSTLTLAV